MKYKLFLGIASVSLVGTGMQAYAQSYSQPASKGADARIIQDTRYMEPEREAPQRQTQRTTEVTEIEPAAGSEDSPFEDFTGIYGGGDVGYSFTEDAEGMNGGVFLGYGFEHMFDMLGAYAALELGYEWSDADGDSGALSYDKNNAWLATFRPGMSIMDDGLGYGIIGYSRAEFEGAGEDEDLDGLVLGVGGALNTGTAFKPRLEYTYTNYEEGSLGGTDFDATENAVKLGAMFQF